ncbi:MAG TPA: CBS domain-containing protein [Candidatus Onthovivens sp.]|nr:CBS domain-containing protein [Candidatus Onthovivens sp.]
MNILLFLTPKSQIRCAKNEMSIRQVLEIIEHHGYTTIPLINKSGQYTGTISVSDLLLFIKDHPFKSIEDFNDVSILKMNRTRDYVPITIDSQMEELIIAAINQNFVPVVDDKKTFIGLITRKAIINYLYLNSDKTPE